MGLLLRFCFGLTSLFLLAYPLATTSQTVSPADEQLACTNAANRLVVELRPHSSTPELYYADTSEPKGKGKVPTLPKGIRPVGPEARMRTEQRANLYERRAEACYQIAVEILRHNGISVDGKESYDRLKQLRDEEEKKQAAYAASISLPVSCRVPATSAVVPEGDSKCIVSNSPALCPSCKSGQRHTCKRLTGTNHAEWVPTGACLASELRAAKNAASGGTAELFSNQAKAVAYGVKEEQRREQYEQSLQSRPRVQATSTSNRTQSASYCGFDDAAAYVEQRCSDRSTPQTSSSRVAQPPGGYASIAPINTGSAGAPYQQAPTALASVSGTSPRQNMDATSCVQIGEGTDANSIVSTRATNMCGKDLEIFYCWMPQHNLPGYGCAENGGGMQSIGAGRQTGLVTPNKKSRMKYVACYHPAMPVASFDRTLERLKYSCN